MNRLFQIGSFCFSLSIPAEIVPPDNFLIFEITNGTPECHYQISIVEKLPVPAGEKIIQREDIVIYQDGKLESRLIGSKGKKGFYAFYNEKSNQQTEVYLSVHGIAGLCFDTVFTSLFALEQRMIERDSLILHCAYIVYHGKAILFSAPSGTGKSTQADLWRQYRGSYTVNGDRALLRKIDNRWMACGWPVCGSSEICNLKEAPIHAVVMLEQSRMNYAKKLSPIQAFAQLYGQITINQWNTDFVERAILNLEDLIGTVPVYQLTCDISEDAVSCLEDALFTER